MPPESEVAFTIRRAEPTDIGSIVQLVEELADYERARDAVQLTDELLDEALFAPIPKLFAHVGTVEGEVVAMAVWFVSYSTWTGHHGIFLEDLYVRPDARRHGIGTALLRELAGETIRSGYTRLDWSVLDWNESAIEFYRSIGAVALAEWTTFRVAGDALGALGGGAPTDSRLR